MAYIKLFYIVLLLSMLFANGFLEENVKVYGPGLKPHKIVMPARYFFINSSSITEKNYTTEWASQIAVEVYGKYKNRNCRIWVNKLDRKDGTFIVRYKVYEKCNDLNVNIYYNSKQMKGFPLKLAGPVLPDQCNCPKQEFVAWSEDYECPKSFGNMHKDLKPFKDVDMSLEVPKIINKYHKPESCSFCHYVIKSNKIYRNCYGKHVGFNMFSDNILLFLSRQLILPDTELIINVGDWPLSKNVSSPAPIFSWCGSEETYDIVMPTYDITESTLENMGRVSLDTLSVQGSIERHWVEREPRLIWRGRDSNLQRLKLVDIARANPDLFNVSLTNFFFYKDKEAEYGPKQPHISFFKFFDFKYQMNIDGTVAAYRFPYLLAGGGTVLKQDSSYYEHFYKDVKPWVHYIPVASDLSDLVEKVNWAKEHDEEAQKISQNAREFANENLLPQHIICYYARLIWEWSKRVANQVEILEGMTHVPQPSFDCKCPKTPQHQEL